MRVSGAVLFFFLLSSNVRAQECGLYRVEDFGDRMVFSLIDKQTTKGQAVNYSIENFWTPLVKSMVNGLCYCVEGSTATDPQYEDDIMYKVLHIEQILSGPNNSCINDI